MSKLLYKNNEIMYLNSSKLTKKTSWVLIKHKVCRRRRKGKHQQNSQQKVKEKQVIRTKDEQQTSDF